MHNALLKETYSGKKVFLTGHTGFKGAWLLQWLHLLGATVKGYALPPQTDADLYHLINGDAVCDSVLADIRDKARLEEEIQNFQPDFIFHLAAQPLVRLSYETPVETFDTNAMGTAHLLDAVRRLDKACIVVLITTDKVYENREWIYPYRETDALGGYDPYSASKACAEIIIHSYIQSYFNTAKFNEHKKAVASARAGNVIGGGDWSKDRIVPDIVRAMTAEQPVVVRNPAAVRPWQHVLGPLNGYLLLGAKLSLDPIRYNGSWNFGPMADDNKQVEDIVQVALNIWGSGSYRKPTLKDQPHEAGLLKLDVSKALNYLNWSPKYNATKAVEQTIRWYKTYHQEQENIREFTIDQILSYQDTN